MKETLCFLKAVIMCLLQCGKWVKLQLAESTPNILEIGSNQDETKKLLQDHEFLLSKLKVRCHQIAQVITVQVQQLM